MLIWLTTDPSNRAKSERNHLAMSTESAKSVRSYFLVGGTIAALIAGGAGFQWGRAQSGSAAEEPGKTSVGKAQVATASGAQAQPRKEAAAKVTRKTRNISIPLDEVAKECMLRVGNDVLESMINRAIIQLACEDAGITITEAEVEEEIIRIAKQFNIPTETWVQMLQSERNISPDQYKRDVIWPMLALKRLAGNKVEVSEEDLHNAFVRHYGSRVKCRMIMCDNVRRANEVWEKARLKPNDFHRLAREHSVDPTSRAMEGSVPPIARYSGSPEIEEVAYKLKENEISGIISIGFGRYVILKCEGFTEQKVTDVSEVREQLLKDLTEEKVQEGVAKLFENLKKSSRIDNYWSNTSTGDVRQVSGAQAPGSDKGGVKPAAGQRPSSQPGVLPEKSSIPAKPGTQLRPNGAIPAKK